MGTIGDLGLNDLVKGEESDWIGLKDEYLEERK